VRSHTANLICAHLVDQSSGDLLRGGAERYTLELATLLRDKGYFVQILHKAIRNFKLNLDGLPVKGIQVPRGAWGNAILSRQVRRAIKAGDLQIYVLAELGFPHVCPPAIGVQHGVWWEADYPLWKRLINKHIQARLVRSFDAYVCVDTNFINWLYSEIPGRCDYAHKLWFVPNFPYRLGTDKGPKGGAVPPTVLFPRRIEFFRGAMFFYSAMKRLWDEGCTARAVFCGDGAFKDSLERVIARDGTQHRVVIKSVPMDRMADEFALADVAVIPTVAREGTSLACIEAMAFACPVIVSHVGGLCNLVIPGMNGLVVDLRVEELASAIRRVLEDQDLRARLISGGLATAEAIRLEQWRARWGHVIDSVVSGARCESVFPQNGVTTGVASGS
jgi:glycosyltransferase involved in cell wall biosynthesis